MPICDGKGEFSAVITFSAILQKSFINVGNSFSLLIFFFFFGTCDTFFIL